MLTSEAIAAHNGATNITLNCAEDCEGSFSWARCEGCNSTMGGERHPAALWTSETKYIDIAICVSCLAFLANGDDDIFEG